MRRLITVGRGVSPAVPVTTAGAPAPVRHHRLVQVGLGRGALQTDEPLVEETVELPVDEEYEALLELARGPLPDLDTPAPTTEFVEDVAEAVRGFERRPADPEAVTAALAAVATAHQQTMTAVGEVLTASAADVAGSGRLNIELMALLHHFASQPPAPAPDIHVHTPQHDLNVRVETPEIHPTFNVEAPAAPEIQVDVHVPETQAPEVTVNVPAPEVTVEAPIVHVAAPDPKPKSVRVEYDDEGYKHFVPVMEET